MKITAIRTTPLALPYHQHYFMSSAAGRGATSMLVEVETDANIIGIGETCGFIAVEGLQKTYEALAPLFVGEPVFDIERLFHRASSATFLNVTGRFRNRFWAGLEMALWDAIGKSCEQPVHRLLGGAVHRQISYFAFPQGDNAEQLAQSASQAVEAGFEVFYMKVGRGEEADLPNVAAVRQAIGDRRLRLDANEAWDPVTAVRLIRKLQKFEPEFVEQPTPNDSIEALRQVKNSVDVPIAADQSVLTLGDVYEVCRRQAADLIVIGPHETGGLLGFKKAAAIAEAAGLNVCVHGVVHETGITTCAANQVSATIHNLDDGNQIMCQLLERDLVASPPLVPKLGQLAVSERPGLGFDLDADAVQVAKERFAEHGQYWFF